MTKMNMNMSMSKRHNFKWSINETLRLEREYDLLEWNIQEISNAHQRSVTAILYKLEKEGIIQSWNEARGFDMNVFQNSFNKPTTENVSLNICSFPNEDDNTTVNDNDNDNDSDSDYSYSDNDNDSDSEYKLEEDEDDEYELDDYSDSDIDEDDEEEYECDDNIEDDNNNVQQLSKRITIIEDSISYLTSMIDKLSNSLLYDKKTKNGNQYVYGYA